MLTALKIVKELLKEFVLQIKLLILQVIVSVKTKRNYNVKLSVVVALVHLLKVLVFANVIHKLMLMKFVIKLVRKQCQNQH